MASQITTATPNVRTITGNLAELVAFTRALEWAGQNPTAAGKPICVRYNSEYAARISTGAWKAKKHKAMAEEARQAWKRLKQVSAGQVWMRHAPRTQGWTIRAQNLARQGKQGKNIHNAIVN